MLLFYFSCLLISLVTSTEAVPRRINPQCRSNVCDDRPECPRTSCQCLFPSRMDCAVYYLCLNGKPIQYRCSPGLLFNNETLSCDYSYNVNCRFSTSAPTSTEVLNTTASLTTTETPAKNTSNSDNTSKETEKTSTIEQTPKAPTTRSSETPIKTTTEEEITTVSSTSVSTTVTTESPTNTKPLTPNSTFTPTETVITTTSKYPSTEFLCPRRFGLFADPKSCNRFYHCSHWKAYHKWCPSNLHFNPRLRVCDWPYRAGCDSLLPTPFEPKTTPASPNPNSTYGTCDCDCCELPIPGDCTAYVLCINKVAFKMNCGPDLSFNPMTGTCDFRENVDCTDDNVQCEHQSGRYLLEGSCSYFVECRSGEKFTRKCPEGLQFNQSSEMCTWIGSCSGHPDVSPNSKIIDNAVCNGCDYCFKPLMADCTRYVRCFQGVATEERCAPGLFFNSVTELCDHDYNVDCPSPQPEPECPEMFGYFPYPGECGMYLHCVNGSATEKSCPGVLHFDPIKKHCDWPWAAGCSDHDSRPTPEPNPEVVIDCDCECCLRPVGTDCKSFILCINQVGFTRSCSSGLRFNPQTENCDFDENVECDINPELPGYSCPEYEGLFPHPEDCEKFIHCAHGFPFIKDCPSKLHFNPKLKVCDWPYSAGCQGYPTTVPPVDDKDFPCDVCDPCFIPDTSDCASYIYCQNGTGHRIRCPENLFFNPDLESCDLPSNVNCPSLPPSKCPKPDGLFPVKQCSQFIHCSNGIPYLKNCPDGLHFNPEILVCDWPKNVKCGEVPITPTLPPPDEEDSDISNGTCNCDCCFFPHDKDCSKYILCLDGYVHVGQCSRGLLFNPSIQNCDFAERVTCGEASPLCPEPNGLFQNSEDCSSYIKCSNGIPEVEYCEYGKHFSVDRKQCLDPCKAQCNSSYDCSSPSPSSSTTPGISTTTPLPPFCLKENGLFPNQLDCSSFYYCVEGKAYLIKCRTGLHFSNEDKNCQHPCEARCDTTVDCNSTSPSSSTTPVAPTTATPSPYCGKGDGLFPNDQDCSSFYQCSRGQAHLVECPSGLHFNNEYKTCDYPCKAKCNTTGCDSTSPSSSTTPVVPTTATPSPYCLEGDGLYPNEQDCSSFYQCLSGQARLYECPIDFHFNKESKICDRRCEAKCNTTNCDTTTPYSSTTPALPSTTTLSPNCPERYGLFLNKDDCTTFYQCADGRAYLVSCPPGLHFSDEHGVCDYPCEAKCNSTIDCNSPSSPTPTVPSTTTLSPHCPASDGLFPSEDDCTSFYECSGGRAHLIRCPSSLHFSIRHKVCEYPCEAQCDKTLDCSTTTTPRITTSTISPHCATPEGLNPVLGDCTAFYLCSNGKEYLIHCPPGLHYSEQHETCETPCLARCNSSLDCRTSVKPVSSTPQPISPECKEPNGLFPNPDDCGSFYQCSNGRSHLIRCPSGLHFSLEDLACEKPCVAGCNISTEDCPSEVPDTKGNCTCNACYLPDPSDCSAFYFCDHGQLSKNYCPFGTLFSKVSRVCEDQTTVDCEANGDSSMCPEPFGFFPYPGECKKFVHCDNGIAHIKECQGELEYDPAHRVCTKPKGYCGEVVIDPNCPLPTGMFPDPNDCSSFYHCENGVAYPKKCASPLMFNSDKKVCDWPQNVENCGKDIISSTTVSSTTPEASVINSTTSTVTPSISPTPPVPECYKVPGVVCPCACRVPTYDECNSFFHCQEDGTACKKFCPEGLYFNKLEMVCDLPENVECRDFFFTTLRRAKLFSHRLRP